jgi:lipoprotein-releasing system permease protein
MMFIILTMIIAVAAFNLVSTLVMTVKDKQADIAILRTLGASPRSIMKIFIVQGTLVGVLGSAAGRAAGRAGGAERGRHRALHRAPARHPVPVEGDLPDQRDPVELRWPDVGSIGGVAVLLAFVATLYPSWAAARVQPAQALRYE